MNNILKICITGASGMLGEEISRYFSEKYDVLGIYNSNKPEINHIELKSVDILDFPKS